MKTYDVLYIGFGPATIFSLLKFPQQNAIVLEKGKCLKDRNPKEVIFGSGGAGAFSDSKLVANPVVGGDINNVCPITDVAFYELADQILSFYNEFFHGVGVFEWIPEDPYQVKSDKLKLLKSKVSHIGTDRSKIVFQNIEKYIKEEICPIHFEEEVTSILDIATSTEKVFVVKTNEAHYLAKKVVIGVGKRSSLVTDLVDQFSLESVNNLVQLGVRLECPNIYMKELVDKFYDFKVVMNSKLGRWRTFCVNSGAAHVAVEKCAEFVSANGHSYSNKENTGLTNFGLMGELKLDLSREQQIELVKKTNINGKLLAQNIDDFGFRVSSTKLNHTTTVPEQDYLLGNLCDYYPKEVIDELEDFIVELKLTFGLDGHFFAPEIKITNPLVKMSNKFEIHPNIFLIGDCSGYSRSIIQSGIIGMVVGEHISRAPNAKM
jgi:uncharacterized FAD-dependent dehydrogenase